MGERKGGTDRQKQALPSSTPPPGARDLWERKGGEREGPLSVPLHPPAVGGRGHPHRSPSYFFCWERRGEGRGREVGETSAVGGATKKAQDGDLAAVLG